MRKYIRIFIIVALLIPTNISGCGLLGNSDDSAIVDQTVLEDASANISQQQSEDVVVASDSEMGMGDIGDELHVEPEFQESTSLKLAGIGFEIPGDWKYEDVSDLVYLGYDIYPDSGDSLVQVCFVSMGDIEVYEDPESVAEAVAHAAWEREGCEDYSSEDTVINNIKTIKYDCSMPEQGIREKAYLIPVTSKGLLSVFYFCPLSNDQYSKDVGSIVESFSIPEDSVIANELVSAKASYFVKEGTISEIIDLNGNAADTASQNDGDSGQTDLSGHNYYKGISADKAKMADEIAKQIAGSIIGSPDYSSDLQKVEAAAKAVAEYCDECAYGTDPERYYRSPYGVFIAGIYTCAGSTRALGRVLDYMGYSWSHVNKNQNRHQWAVLTMDGQTGFADGMAGIAGYGEMKDGMVLPDGSTIHFSE